jgi:type IV secretion system protein VirD4
MNGWLRLLRFFLMPGGIRGTTDSTLEKTPPGQRASAHGSSRFLTYKEARKAGFVAHPDSGKIVLGRAAEAKWQHEGKTPGWQPFRFQPQFGHVSLGLEGHVTCFAPTRSGKTTGMVIPIMLSYPGSIVVIDPKAEIYHTTANYRQEKLKHEIHVVDPYGISGAVSSGFQLGDFARSDCFNEDCKTLAKLIAPEKKNDPQPFFRQAAQQFIEGMIAYLHSDANIPGEQRGVSQLCRWMNQPPDVFEVFLQRMVSSRSVLASQEALKYLGHQGDTLGSIRSEINITIDCLKNPNIEKALSGSCNLNQQKEKPMTVYLCMPEDQLLNDAVFLRLFLASALAGIKRNRSQPKHRPLVICDEFQNLGASPEIARDISLLAGMGGNILLFVQSLGKLEDLYSKEQLQDFLANSYAKIFLRPSDARTKEDVSRDLGETTILQCTEEKRPPGPDQFFGTRHTSYDAKPRPLMTPSEVGNMPSDQMIVFIQSKRPLPVLLNRYFEDPLFIDRLWISKTAKLELKLKVLWKRFWKRFWKWLWGYR